MLVTRTTDATNCWLPVCLYLTLLMTCIETPRLAWWHLAGVGSLYTGAASWRMLFLLLLPHSAVLSQTPVYTARPHMVHPAWCIHGSYGQGKSKYHGAKVNKNAEKNLNCCTQTAYSGSTFVCSFVSMSTFEFVSPLLFLVWLQAIENRHWYFTRMD